MKRTHAIALVLLVSAGLVGLHVLLSRALAAPADWQLTDDLSTLVLGIAVAAVLALLGFFLGVLHVRASGKSRADRNLISRLKEALDIERQERKKVALERHEQAREIISLKEEIGGLRRSQETVGKSGADEQAVRAAEAEIARLRTECDRLQVVVDMAQAQVAAPAPERVSAAGAGKTARAELEQLKTDCERLRKELGSRRERMVDLQADLSVAQTEVEQARAEADELRTQIPEPSVPLERLEGQSLREVLETIIKFEGVTVALVADDQGLVVDAAGTVLQPDSLAAVSGLVAELSPRVSDLLPIGEISTVALGDAAGKVMEVRYFPLFGESCALAIIRDETHPHPEVAKNAIETIIARLAD